MKLDPEQTTRAVIRRILLSARRYRDVRGGVFGDFYFDVMPGLKYRTVRGGCRAEKLARRVVIFKAIEAIIR
jgi:hypothetical protein